MYDYFFSTQHTTTVNGEWCHIEGIDACHGILRRGFLQSPAHSECTDVCSIGTVCMCTGGSVIGRVRSHEKHGYAHGVLQPAHVVGRERACCVVRCTRQLLRPASALGGTIITQRSIGSVPLGAVQIPFGRVAVVNCQSARLGNPTVTGNWKTIK